MAEKNRSAEKPVDFEKSLQELEEIVKKLEAGNLPLEESLKLFEQGVKLARWCKDKLHEAELKITELTQEEE